MTFTAVPSFQWARVLAACLAMATLVASAAAPPAAKPTKWEAGLKAFNQGEFEVALKALDAAAAETTDPAVLERVHLLRAQCFAAKADFVRAEDAFAKALDANPEASLDPARVDPAVVKMLDAMRARLSGELVIRSAPDGAQVTLDGKAVGKTPVMLMVSIGRHKIEAQWKDETPTTTEVLVRARSQTRVEWVQALGAAPAVVVPTAPPPPPERFKLQPLGGIRVVNEQLTTDTSLEVGAGVGFWHARVSVYARVFPKIGLTPRLGWMVPIREGLQAQLELEAPMIFFPGENPPMAFGIGGGGGVEWTPVPWMGVFALVGGRHYVQYPNRLDHDRFTLTLGGHLKLP